MKLDVYVNGQHVAVLESAAFSSVLAYLPNVNTDDFVSLTMPVRLKSYEWNEPLHPYFQQNLPEGYLLQILREKAGPAIGASPAKLLALVGRNTIGRVKVAEEGAKLEDPINPLNLSDLLDADNSLESFSQWVKKFAYSGVSGMVPKFLDAEREPMGGRGKSTVITRRHIIKGCTDKLPYITLNEHLCMKVAQRVMPTASTTISRDGRVLAVDRFDVRNSDENFGMEDFCSLLGLPPANKYETTWEKISASLTAYVPGPLLHESRRNLAALLLLTYALRNADCHSKNVALLYTSHRDVKLSPAYDMITTTVYEDWRTSPPGIKIDGRRNWLPGAYLRKSIQAHFLVSEAEQRDLITQIADAISDTLPELQFAIQQYPGFKEIGSSMVSQWTEGINSLLDKKCYNLGRRLQVANAKEGKSGKKHKRRVIGRSEAFKRRPSDTN